MRQKAEDGQKCTTFCIWTGVGVQREDNLSCASYVGENMWGDQIPVRVEGFLGPTSYKIHFSSVFQR